MSPAPIDPDRPGRKCSVCKEWKPRAEFHRSRGQKDGMATSCKPCNVVVTREYARRHAVRLRCKKYGITVEDYETMFERQGGKCAVCRSKPVAHIDHDHETGRVRGLLCSTCNKGLGLLQDDPVVLSSALMYVGAVA